MDFATKQRRELKEARVREGGACRDHATVALFERHGFERVRQIGKHHWVVKRFVG